MSLTAVRHAAFSARRTYTVGGTVDVKRPDSETSSAERRTGESDDGATVALEPHWQASIESATD